FWPQDLNTRLRAAYLDRAAKPPPVSDQVTAERNAAGHRVRTLCWPRDTQTQTWRSNSCRQFYLRRESGAGAAPRTSSAWQTKATPLLFPPEAPCAWQCLQSRPAHTTHS